MAKKLPRLLIVSDTAMRRTAKGNMVFEPAAREVENFQSLFRSITWIGFDFSSSPDYPAKLLNGNNIRFIYLPRVGGYGAWNKIKLYSSVPFSFMVIFYHALKNDIVHNRAPSLPAFLAILVSRIFRPPLYWHKFAGNWIHDRLPFSYRLQKKMLAKEKNSIVTINGNWPGQRNNILSFENPCLSTNEIAIARPYAENKSFEGKLSLLFAGRIEMEKGVNIIIEALKKLDPGQISKMTFAGEGQNRDFFEKKSKLCGIPCIFTGWLSREALNVLYAESHIFILPSQSEGFPKVVSESSSYGCVPVVSDVSSISQYIETGYNGICLEEITPGSLASALTDLMANRNLLKEMSKQAMSSSDQFTYEKYNYRIRNEILAAWEKKRGI